MKISNPHHLTISLLTVVCVVISGCSTTEIVKANSTPALQAKEPLPLHLYLDVGILPLQPGIPDSEDEVKKKLIIPDVRRAESQYIAYHLKDTLEFTGNWGAVRVTPNISNAVDISVSGKIIQSDGELLRARLKATDSTGKIWVNKEYSDQASKFSYDGPKEDPFQDFYNDFANDLLKYREILNEEKITEIRRISSLKYAISLSPEAFGNYLTMSRGGNAEINQLPADNDRMLERVDKIKEREYLFVDTLDEYYGKFYRDMKASYDEWRFATYDEAITLRRMQKQARNRLLGGAALIAGGLYAGSESGTYAGQAASVGSVLGGISSIKSGLDLRKEAEIHAESLRELSHSLGSEIKPYVLDIEGRTIELTGTANAQYDQWKNILKEIYTTETGTLER
ncbi:MAG TPA: hypothetical protein QF517_00250 [Pseudomonadales bacterium]|jgi:hypothetical protein|nr:hypothetical protein [Gammaproteobacteria bacterium]MDP6024362.1 hypothetical protein [Pseudomonadales bacterium]MDP6316559.1 hypothetical protein [Pseudomonadales bacterium]MDP7315192.1 hypothetical protein [Pseudomonadales bacterium]HJL60355.1 hypothetical protein [Pseudomonadales bacterium]|tara:strand:- start:6500 stop:7690 length:1191 start_codon:yes stop_codon:yes gene_type:complete